MDDWAMNIIREMAEGEGDFSPASYGEGAEEVNATLVAGVYRWVANHPDPDGLEQRMKRRHYERTIKIGGTI